MKIKQELITQIVSLLGAMIAVEEEKAQITMTKQTEPIEYAQSEQVRFIKECTEAVKGLSEHTVRQLVSQEKIPYIRTGQGKHGKILIAKSALLSYFGGTCVMENAFDEMQPFARRQKA